MSNGNPIPSDTPGQICSCAELRKATRLVSQFYDRHLQPTGLKITQYSVLANVAAAPELTLGALAHRLGMDRTTLTRNLRPLIKRGLVALVPGDDSRTRSVHLTAAGTQALTAARKQWQRAQTAFAQTLGSTATDALHAALHTASAAMRS